jgi:Xaa-Pro aminopeptidase
MATARLIYDTPEQNSDLYYAIKMFVPDPFPYLEVRGKKIMIMNDLEIDRAKKQARVDEVWSINPFIEAAKKKHKTQTTADVIYEILRKAKIKKVQMPSSSSFTLVDALRTKGIKVISGGNPFYPQRLIKTHEEKRIMEKSQHTVFAALKKVEDTLRASKVKGGKLYHGSTLLTSDRVRSIIDVFLMERGYVASDTIVACGAHSIDPHDVGSGPLKANEAIIVDIFPRSLKTRYFGDATRTFCKGKASPALKHMYGVVKRGQELGLKMLKAGVNGHKVHKAILDLFDKEGYPTGEKDGRMQGFFHSTGHGIGLDLHESPTRVGPVDQRMKAGNVVSVEPGLYFKGIGGVRIEDLVYITKTGCKILSHYPKRLEIR